MVAVVASTVAPLLFGDVMTQIRASIPTDKVSLIIAQQSRIVQHNDAPGELGYYRGQKETYGNNAFYLIDWATITFDDKCLKPSVSGECQKLCDRLDWETVLTMLESIS